MSEKISVIGLGYVGLPLAIMLSDHYEVIGFDLNKDRIESYKNGHDVTGEVGNKVLMNTTCKFTHVAKDVANSTFYIIAVPTPINTDKTPDLQPIIGASEIVGENIRAGSCVVFESTVYPGVTEEICVPILEKKSGLKCGRDFKVGYSPERINPGDKVNRLDTVIKVVSGMDDLSLERISAVYESVVKAGVHKAKDIRTAEAAKVIENAQRDLNIAFMNELAIIFNQMGIDTNAVLEAAGTKWNFLKFKPGLVGGHCIGVDPYYLTYKAEQLGYHPQIILSGRRINDSMGKYVAEATVKKLIAGSKQVLNANVGVFGFTFKEDCPDIRNTRVIDIIKELEEYGVNVMVSDAVANQKEATCEYGIEFLEESEMKQLDAIIVAVAHDSYKDFTLDYLKGKMDGGIPILIDVKGIYDKSEANSKDFIYWCL